MDKVTWSLGLKKLQKDRPNHPFLPSIEKGYSIVTAAYLKKALDSLDVPVIKAKIQKNDSTLKKLSKELSNLFIKRGKLSNSLHQCIDKEGRAAVSQQIGWVQLDIEKAMRRLDYYRENKKLPIEKKVEQFYIPTDGYELAKLEKNKKRSIARGQKNLEERRKKGLDTKRQEEFLQKSKQDI